MPIGFTTEDVFSVKLSIDEGTPEDQRILWRCRALSVADVRKVWASTSEARHADTMDDRMNKYREAIMLGVVGWERGPEPFSWEALERNLSLEGIDTLAVQYPAAVALSELEKKVSQSRRSSAPDAKTSPEQK
jgi:hypothetical protein